MNKYLLWKEANQLLNKLNENEPHKSDTLMTEDRGG